MEEGLPKLLSWRKASDQQQLWPSLSLESSSTDSSSRFIQSLLTQNCECLQKQISMDGNIFIYIEQQRTPKWSLEQSGPTRRKAPSM